jgi:p-hydroxybenzoate 3-monooxygenase
MRTTVAILGAGPAGLVLARLLHRAGIDCVLLERQSREYVQNRQRAGTLEPGTAEVLRACGAGDRLDAQALPHRGIELRFDRRSVHLDFEQLVGRSVLTYPQTEVVRDLIGAAERDGQSLHFEASVTRVEGIRSHRPTVHFVRDGRAQTLECDWVAGCDGYHGAGVASVPRAELNVHEKVYPYSWLGVFAQVPPSRQRLVYAHSPRGFALHSMRPPAITRLYLQVPNGTDPADWPDVRIWDELDARFAGADGWRLPRGPITGRSVIEMRSEVRAPMRHGRLFLAGDAAHIVPPTGAKGLNLAVADVVVLAEALVEAQLIGSSGLLDAYSATCLRRVWQTEQFSSSMTTMMHIPDGQSPFDLELQLASLDRIATSPAAATAFAEQYVGVPLPQPRSLAPVGSDAR